MKHRNVTGTLLLVLLMIVGAIWFSRQQPRAKEAFRRHPEKLLFTPTALCLLQCLELQRSDAEQILKTGLVLYHKSNRRAYPCPVWVIQGNSYSGASYKIRLEQCVSSSVVVHVERSGTGISCACTGNNERTKPLTRGEKL